MKKVKNKMKEKIIDKNYGSIPHLSCSKMGQQADKKITIGQEIILTKKARDWKDLIIVTEKLDGSNVGIIRKGDERIAITRKGYRAIDSPFRQHHCFDKWFKENLSLFSWLPDGYRICGEWMALAHGTRYDLLAESPFNVFDIFNYNNERLCYMDMIKLCEHSNIRTVPLVHIGQPVSVKNALTLLGFGMYGKSEKPEGLVYRCERLGKVDFLAKYVRADKEDGKYLGEKEVWNTINGLSCEEGKII